MNTSKLALITGCLGGIGRALVQAFADAGYTVIGMDLAEAATGPGPLPQHYISADLGKLCTDAAYRDTTLQHVQALVQGQLKVLINNAAWQVVKPIEQLSAADWMQTQNVNVMAPFLLTQALLAQLEAAKGSVINIASIHGQLTKPEFVAYATSKTALLGMTRAMAVELGARVRVNAVCPAAIATPMLVAGFDGKPEAYQQLADMHPVGRIGQPQEVARTCILLADDQLGFMTGASIALDGGIGARLHDPV
ncbi:MAG: SDR family oxidoreductase [Aquabacterium sp.]|nr:SDR family oxidoreductase [Aquabacterium sp.]